jgi:hypothetical protein
MQAIWLDYTTKYLIEQDINLIEYYDNDKLDKNNNNHINKIPTIDKRIEKNLIENGIIKE